MPITGSSSTSRLPRKSSNTAIGPPAKRLRTNATAESSGSGVAAGQRTENRYYRIQEFAFPPYQKKPPQKIEAATTHDLENGDFYRYGGLSSERIGEFGSELHVLNTRTKVWRDLKKAPSTAPSSRTKLSNLPLLGYPALEFARLPDGRRILLLFGGYNISRPSEDDPQPTNELIVIDLDALSWKTVKISGIPGPARVNASMVYVEHRLFIFAGRPACAERYSPHNNNDGVDFREEQEEREDEEEDEEGLDDRLDSGSDDEDITPLVMSQGPHAGLRSYSVLKHDATSDSWKWEIAEEGFPDHVPSMGYNITAKLVGNKILLTPGRYRAQNFYILSPEKIIFFNFLTPGYGFSAGQMDIAHLPNPFPRGRIIAYKILYFHHASKPFIIICCWMIAPKLWRRMIDSRSSCLFVELYHYALPPNNCCITPLGQVKKIANLLGLFPYTFFTAEYPAQPDSPPSTRLYVAGSRITDNGRDTGKRVARDVDEKALLSALFDSTEDVSSDVEVDNVSWRIRHTHTETERQPTFDLYAEIPLADLLSKVP